MTEKKIVSNDDVRNTETDSKDKAEARVLHLLTAWVDKSKDADRTTAIPPKEPVPSVFMRNGRSRRASSIL